MEIIVTATNTTPKTPRKDKAARNTDTKHAAAAVSVRQKPVKTRTDKVPPRTGGTTKKQKAAQHMAAANQNGPDVGPGKEALANIGRNTASFKSSRVLAMLRMPNGVTIEAIQQATGWQAHSVRGFLSGNIRKKLGLMLVSDVDKDGIRHYRIDDTAADGAGPAR